MRFDLRLMCDILQITADMIVEIHLHDNHGKENEHLNPGKGKTKIEQLLK